MLVRCPPAPIRACIIKLLLQDISKSTFHDIDETVVLEWMCEAAHYEEPCNRNPCPVARVQRIAHSFFSSHEFCFGGYPADTKSCTGILGVCRGKTGVADTLIESQAQFLPIKKTRQTICRDAVGDGEQETQSWSSPESSLLNTIESKAHMHLKVVMSASGAPPSVAIPIIVCVI